ncbi:hypothetical protein EDB80DRAFT_703840 [Ilyonectria destructans]|nr:hypothetical protein EDB80DRAFT_703840 [Ilyonectria destructans]
MATRTGAMTADNPLKRKRTTPGQTRIEVRLPSKPPDYVPGTSPPLQRIDLLPARDSTAYIVERIMLPSPGLAADGLPLPKRMTYIVCWHDLRAACLLVPAMQVLDYVSPMALEEWEYQVELELDEERARMEKEKTEKIAKPKRRGRPPAHTQIEAAAVAAPQNHAMKTGRPKKGAMSITTPTKARLKDFEGLSDDEASPSRQLEREHLGSMQVTAESDLDEVDMVIYKRDFEDLRDKPQPKAISKKLPNSHSLSGFGVQSNRNLPPNQPFGPFTSTGIASQQSTPKTAPVSLSSSTKKKETPVPLPWIPAIRPSQNGSSPAIERMPSFTPLGGVATFASSGSRSPNPATPSAAPGTKPKSKPKPTDSAKKPKKESKKTSKTALSEGNSAAVPEPDAEPVWEVKRVEATELFEVEGVGLVRYFQVLWEGDWPPEQNPSWEPEANLPPALVRNFMNKVKKKPAPQKKKPLKQSTLPWAPEKLYKSVSEAFEGGEDDPDLLGHPIEDAHVAANGDGDGPEELFVVEEPPAKKARKQGALGWNGNRNEAAMESGILPAYY